MRMGELQEQKENVQSNLESLRRDIVATKDNQQQLTSQARELREAEAKLEEEAAPSVDNTNDVLGLYKITSNIQWDFDRSSDDSLIGSLCFLFLLFLLFFFLSR